jgi:hypothetical protein
VISASSACAGAPASNANISANGNFRMTRILTLMRRAYRVLPARATLLAGRPHELD